MEILNPWEPGTPKALVVGELAANIDQWWPEWSAGVEELREEFPGMPVWLWLVARNREAVGFGMCVGTTGEAPDIRFELSEDHGVDATGLVDATASVDDDGVHMAQALWFADGHQVSLVRVVWEGAVLVPEQPDTPEVPFEEFPVALGVTVTDDSISEPELYFVTPPEDPKGTLPGA